MDLLGSLFAKWQLRCAWYQVMATLEDEVTQMQGVVNICYSPGSQHMLVSIGNFSEVAIKGGDILMNLPIRVTSYHFCYNNVIMEYILATLRRAFGKQVALRLRAHYGTHIRFFTKGVEVLFCNFSRFSRSNRRFQALISKYNTPC
jgi:hypothetical protein